MIKAMTRFFVLVAICGTPQLSAAFVMTPPVVEACLQFRELTAQLDDRSAQTLDRLIDFAISDRFLSPGATEISITVNGLRSTEAVHQTNTTERAILLKDRYSLLSDLIARRAGDKLKVFRSEVYFSRNDEFLRGLIAAPDLIEACDAKVSGNFEAIEKNARFCKSPAYGCTIACTSAGCREDWKK